ncbi:hypothetical protein [Insolitispirillum peregrinum]|uniref:Uncharacterized protein n=1 Tax=Insolitispirillum peregrinum TaxID=80876 RepID=A0A1N7PDP2_9PROT|nr:hypothetical protein [Insolitispirillum peregrinum]SIT08656.1 hypothetical protein SAMN05421779_106244 [Insolitispirillum peregrinum]
MYDVKVSISRANDAFLWLKANGIDYNHSRFNAGDDYGTIYFDDRGDAIHFRLAWG